MLRTVSKQLFLNTGRLVAGNGPLSVRASSHGAKQETPEEFDQRFINFFNNPQIDGWLLRKGLTELQHQDVVPEPAVMGAALRACRRVNDYALATRFLEAVRVKCGRHVNKIYPYLMQELKPTMDELGVSSVEEMGYDKPEFHTPSPDWWPKEYYKLYNIRERKPSEVFYNIHY